MAGLAISVVVLSACAANSAIDAGPPEQHAGEAAGCQPSFTPVPPADDIQYYRLSVQLANCNPMDIPLSVDVGAPWGKGTPLSQAPSGGGTSEGGDLKGADILWDKGDGGGVAGSATTSIPKGGSLDGSSSGPLVGLTTVPYWSGHAVSAEGPCANSAYVSDGSGIINAGDPCEDVYGSGNPNTQYLTDTDFKGQWAIYLPTVTLEAGVVAQPVGYPYVAEYNDVSQGQQQPGAVATGIAVARKPPGGQMLPLYGKGSRKFAGGPGPPLDPVDFNAQGCIDNLVVQDGANHSLGTKSNWSTQIHDLGRSWQQTSIMDTFQVPGDLSESPVLLLTKGWLNTDNGSYSTIPLNTPTNKLTSRKQHTFQGHLRLLNQVTCGGSGQKIGVGMIGGQAQTLDVQSSTLVDPVVANSTIAYVNFRQAVATATTKGVSIFGFTNFRDGVDEDGDQGTPSNMLGVNLANADLTGSVFPKVTFGEASLQGADLYYADLSSTDLHTQADIADYSNDLECHTLFVDGPSVSDCNTLPAQARWPSTPISTCQPNRCVYVSIYNNTTRYLSQGLMSCKDGQQASDFRAPQVISPLDTGQMGFIQEGGAAHGTNIDCSVTYSNGPWGKIQVRATNGGGSWQTQVDSGYCAARNQTSDPCLPKAGPIELPTQVSDGGEVAFDATKDALWPPARSTNDTVRVDSTVNTNNAMGATTVDVVICEPEAYNASTGKCSSKPALPAYVGEAPGSGDLATDPVTIPGIDLPAGYLAYEMYPSVAGIPTYLANSAHKALGYRIREATTGREVATLVTEEDIDKERVATHLDSIRKEAEGVVRFRTESGTNGLAWSRDNDVMAVALVDKRLIEVVAADKWLAKTLIRSVRR